MLLEQLNQPATVADMLMVLFFAASFSARTTRESCVWFGLAIAIMVVAALVK